MKFFFFESFKVFQNFVQNQKDTNIKILRRNNGGEFCGSQFENNLEKCGIIHQNANPFSLQQNGLIERMNRTIVEKAKCLLIDAQLEKLFGQKPRTQLFF